MIEILSSECLWVSSLKALFGLYLLFAGGSLAVWTALDIRQCRQLRYEHLIQLTCAGSAWGVALLCIV